MSKFTIQDISLAQAHADMVRIEIFENGAYLSEKNFKHFAKLLKKELDKTEYKLTPFFSYPILHLMKKQSAPVTNEDLAVIKVMLTNFVESQNRIYLNKFLNHMFFDAPQKNPLRIPSPRLNPTLKPSI